MIKEMKRMIYTIIFIYVALVTLLFFVQRSMMYFPDKTVTTPQQYKVPEMSVLKFQTSDGLSIEGWYKAPEDKEKPVVVFFHGNASHHGYRSFKAKIVMDQGYGAMLAGYRGYGGNPGKPSEQGLYNDARAHIDWLLNEEGIAAENIVLYGESLGTGVATQMANEYPNSKGLILETPFNSTVAVAQWRFFFIPVTFLMKDRFESDKKIAQFEQPLLIMHGTKDHTVPYRFGQRLYSAATEPKTFKTFEGGGHVNLYDLGAGKTVLEFIESLEKGTDE